MNLQEFTKTVNDLIAQEKTSSVSSLSDSRIKEEISERRIRDYLNKGILSRPEKMGKSLVFTQDHVEQVLAIRALQSQGVSDSALGSTIDTQSVETKSFGRSYYGLTSDNSLVSSSSYSSSSSPASFTSLDSSTISPINMAINNAVAQSLEPQEYNFSASISSSTPAIEEFDSSHPKNLFNQLKNLAGAAAPMNTRSLSASSIPKISKSFSSLTRSSSSSSSSSSPFPFPKETSSKAINFDSNENGVSPQSIASIESDLEEIKKEKMLSDSFASHINEKMSLQAPTLNALSQGSISGSVITAGNIDSLPVSQQSMSKYSFGPVDVFINDNELNQCTQNQKEQIAKAIENVIKKNK